MAKYPNAVQYPTNKYGYNGRIFRPVGAVIHSMAGYSPNHLPLLDDPNRRGSWHFSILFNGTVQQHVDSWAASWHCGDMEGNLAYWGIEMEGDHGTKVDAVTDPQLIALADLLRWLWQSHGLSEFSHPGTLREHRSFGTSTCPNERYTGDRMWNRLLLNLNGEEDEMPQFTEEEARFLREKIMKNLLHLNYGEYRTYREYIDAIAAGEIALANHTDSHPGSGAPHNHDELSGRTHTHDAKTGPAEE